MSSRSEQLPTQLRINLDGIQQRIAAACLQSGRLADEVQLVAVTKSVDLPVIAALINCGQHLLAENRPQQLIERASALRQHVVPGDTDSPHIRWHLIGQLQSNKIRSILPWVEMIHSVESVKQLERIVRISKELNVSPQLLLEVNVSGEHSKGGFSADQLRTEWERICELGSSQIAGMMTMAPFTDDLELIRSTFCGLRELRDELQTRSPQMQLRELSMGMSHDFEIAILEGATLVRVGTALFEGCPPSSQAEN